jgi:hypothetical protein
MTKISHKEYVASIADMMKTEWLRMINENMINELNMFENTDDNQRVIQRLLNDSIHTMNKRLTTFVAEKGVPRKQRVVKKDEKAEKDEDEKKNDKKISAYTNYCQLHRQSVKEKNTGAKAIHITQKLSEMWNALTIEEKKAYELKI